MGAILAQIAASGLIAEAPELLDRLRKKQISFSLLKDRVYKMIAKLQSKDRALYNELSAKYNAAIGITGSDTVNRLVRRARGKYQKQMADIETKMAKNNVIASGLEADLSNLSLYPYKENAGHLREKLNEVEKQM